MIGADCFIFVGFGLGYNLDALLARVSRETAHIFVVESEPEILRAAISGLAKLSDVDVAAAIESIEAIKTGRPAKADK